MSLIQTIIQAGETCINNFLLSPHHYLAGLAFSALTIIFYYVLFRVFYELSSTNLDDYITKQINSKEYLSIDKRISDLGAAAIYILLPVLFITPLKHGFSSAVVALMYLGMFILFTLQFLSTLIFNTNSRRSF